MNCTMVVSNAKAESVQMSCPVKGSAATPPLINNMTLVVKDPALMGQIKAGKNYVVTISEAPAA